MSINPQLSALPLNSLVIALAEMNNSTDIALAAAEMALGWPTATRNLDLCFGNCQVEAQLSGDLLKPIIVGRGIARLQGGTLPLTVVSTEQVEQAWAASDLLGANSVENAYAFGSVFQVAYQLSSDSGPIQYTGLLVNLVRGGNSQSGTPLLITRDCGLSAAQDISNQGSLPTPLVPWTGDEIEGTTFAIEILRFVLDIDSYVESNLSQTALTVHMTDLRRPRGWGGFASEEMAGTLVGPLCQVYNALTAEYTAADTSLYNLLTEWVSLSCWTPNFLTFWSGNMAYMGSALQAYLLNRLDIVL